MKTSPDAVLTPIIDKNGTPTRRYKKTAKTGTGAKRVAAAGKPKSAATSSAKPTMTDKLDGYAEEIKSAVSNLANDENWNHFLNTMSKFHNYSFYNQMLIQLQTGGKATYVAGFKKWQEFGRNVKKGEKAIVIAGYSPRQKEVVDENGKPVLDENGEPKVKRWSQYFGVGVFDISQTEGDPLPTAHREMTGEPPAGLIQNLEEAIAKKGFRVEYTDDLPGEVKGATSTDPLNKRVQIKASLNEAGRARTLAHELFHIAAGHIERASEYHTGHDGARNAMEVEAESGAYVLLRANGMDEHAETSSTYIAGWAGVRDGRDRAQMVEEAAKNVAKTTKELLTDFTWDNANVV